MKRILFVVAVFAAATSFAQNKKLPLEGAVQAGMLEGESGTAFQLGLRGGFKFSTWSTAIGTGLDYYGVRSIPLYLHVQKRLFNRPQTPFAYINGGYHFPWKSEEARWSSWSSEINRNGGLYYEAGLGYQFSAFNNKALFFAAGYSFKRYAEEILSNRFCFEPGPCPNYRENFTYRMRRLSITTGLRF